MWSVSTTRLFSVVSLRRITLFFVAILMALFTLLPALTPNVSAQASGAVWVDANTISYNDQTYAKEQDGAAALYDGMPDGATTYLYTDQSVNPPVSKVLYFEKGTTITEAKNVKYAEYNLPPSGGNKLTRKGTVQDVTITPDANNAGADGETTDGTEENKQTSSCDNKYIDGIAWIICPVTNAIAKAMDWLYTSVISQFLMVPPVTTNMNSPLYRAWDMTRNIANMIFVIGFLIIIYSQMTSVGLSSYGVKRLLPRLVIAAVLVNISYWITAIAVDVSNILGVGIHASLTSIRENIAIVGSAKTPDYSWEAISTFILSGGGIALITGLAIKGILAQTVGAAIWILLPFLVGVILSALVAIMVMAARQALIIILIIVSPLAFVAYLLPNTEKYFHRWRELFTTMLVMFPIFSVVFSGSQLAGTAIMQSVSPDSTGSITIIILGMAAQVMPLAITPLLMRVSGSLIGKVAGIVNNPNRGLVDRSRNYAKEKAEQKRARTMGGMDENGNRLRDRSIRGLGGRIAQSMENKKKGNEGLMKGHEEGIEAGYLESERYRRAHDQHEMASRYKTIGEEESKRHFQNHLEHNSGIRELDTRARVTTDRAKVAADRNDTNYQSIQTNPILAGAEGTALRALADQARQASYEAKSEQHGQTIAQKQHESNYNKALLEVDDPYSILQRAGNGSVNELDERLGPARVKIVAQNQQLAAAKERRDNIKQSFVFDNTPESVILELAKGNSAGGITVDTDTQEAAMEVAINSGNYDNVIELSRTIDITTNGSASIRQTLASTLGSMQNRPRYIPSSWLSSIIPQGIEPTAENVGNNLRNSWVKDALEKRKYDTNALSTTDPSDLKFLLSVLSNSQADNQNTVYQDLDPAVVNRLKDDIKRAFKDEQIYRTLGSRTDHIYNLGSFLRMDEADLRPDET